MRYHAIFDKAGGLVRIGTGPGGIEITEGEYNAYLDEILEKNDLVERRYAGEISDDDIPAEWQEEILRRVDERIGQEGEYAEAEIGGEELLEMIEEVL